MRLDASELWTIASQVEAGERLGFVQLDVHGQQIDLGDVHVTAQIVEGHRADAARIQRLAVTPILREPPVSRGRVRPARQDVKLGFGIIDIDTKAETNRVRGRNCRTRLHTLRLRRQLSRTSRARVPGSTCWFRPADRLRPRPETRRLDDRSGRRVRSKHGRPNQSARGMASPPPRNRKDWRAPEKPSRDRDRCGSPTHTRRRTPQRPLSKQGASCEGIVAGPISEFTGAVSRRRRAQAHRSVSSRCRA